MVNGENVSGVMVWKGRGCVIGIYIAKKVFFCYMKATSY